MADAVVTNTYAATNGQKLALIPSTAAYASRPSSPTAGDIFMPSDSFYVERYSGSAWAPWGPIFPMTPPVNGDFSWVNQGGASVSTTNGGIFLSAPASSSVSYRCRVKSAPSTPYTITAAFLAGIPNVNYQDAGLLFRESGTGKMVHWKVNSALGAAVSRSTNATTFSSNVFWVGIFNTQPLFWRIADNATNLIFSLSFDGQNFIDLYSESRTAHMAGGPNQVGFFTNDQTNVRPANLTLLSWKQA